ncbi:MAG: hypothetical protein ACJ74J_20590 [Blastocatellia bacterium]
MICTKGSALLRAAALLLATLFVFNIAAIAGPQSGRRIPKRPTTADPTTPKESEPPVVQPEEKKPTRPAIPILLAGNLDNIIYSSSAYLNIVMDGFLERASKINAVKIEPAGRDTTRKQAIDAAKASKERYVVWFRLVSDSMSSTPTSDYAYGYSLYIDYQVYEPATGKSKTSGHVYQRTKTTGPVGVPLPGRTGVEYSLRYAGAELADRVLSVLDLNSPTTTPPTN